MNPWIISYRSFDSSTIRLRETLFTLGNGYIASRGAFEDSSASTHYPGTYIAGGYNRAKSHVADKILTNEDLVNFPNWLPLTFKVEDEDWFEITKTTLLDFCELLHLRKGILKRFYRIKDHAGRIFLINSIRFISQHHSHLAGIRYSITSENWTGKITIRSSLCGGVINKGVPRYQELNGHHLETMSKGVHQNEYLYLQARTLQSHLEVSEVIKTEVFKNHSKIKAHFKIIEEKDKIHQLLEISIEPYQKVTLQKIMSVYHSKDIGISENLYDAIKLIQEKGSFPTLIKHHIWAWKQLWHKADIEIESQNGEQPLIRFHVFHALQSISKNSIQQDYGAPARGLHGEAYRGHVFWDEVYILPFYFSTFPCIARSMLMYRYHRLNSARQLAREKGYQGAMFPWQSASNGEEETQQFHLNPQSGTWGPDLSSQQIHVNMAIAYNIYNYYQFTQDIVFLKDYGAEIIFEIAKFISSYVTFNPGKNKFELLGVMGPDEYHEKEINAETPGLRNNTYTNIMSVWVLEKALSLKDILPSFQLQSLYELLNIRKEDLKKWKNITTNIFIPFHEEILSQFEGYECLNAFDWKSYKKKYGQCERLDRILKAENKDPNQFQIAKQPDTLMLFYLLGEQELLRILYHAGYLPTPKLINDTLYYYLQRTSHGSTLSKITLASILTTRDPALSVHLYQEALISDLQDTQGGTTEEGIHLGVMTGTLSFLKQFISGLGIYENCLSLNPQLPSWIKRLKFKVLFKQNLYVIELFSWGCVINLEEQNTPNCRLLIKNKWLRLSLNNKQTLVYHELLNKARRKKPKQRNFLIKKTTPKNQLRY
ncbi:glycoside hydrolase family 65 protein [Legionella rowbothamii]|uniref:glycoside hydrolase family 65 protein n=1 Tax=Legionella rowbothamii TaxID=96229 RepID=UPI0010553E8B|nr:glycoside hydrolase family 65 protein [Legionella rowbothamii]